MTDNAHDEVYETFLIFHVPVRFFIFSVWIADNCIEIAAELLDAQV